MIQELKKKMEAGLQYLQDIRKSEDRYVKYWFKEASPYDLDSELDQRIENMKFIISIIDGSNSWSKLKSTLHEISDTVLLHCVETGTEQRARRLSADLALRLMEDVESNRQMNLPL